MDATEQLRFIVHFALLDLDNIRDGDWLNLQEDFGRFHPIMTILSPGAVIFDPGQDPEYGKYPKPKFIPLQNELRALLQTKGKSKGTSITTPININLHYMYMAGDGLIAIGKARDLFLQRVINLLVLDKDQLTRVRQCSACKKFFVRVRRQVHCSPQCADKANYEDRQKKAKAKRKKRRRK